MKGNSWQTQSRPASSPFAMPLFQKNSANGVSGGLNDDLLIRATITDAIKRCSKKREQIAEEMSHSLGVKVTVQMLAFFTAESKKMHRWPAAWDRAFCAAVDDTRLLKCRVEAAGFRVITQAEADLLELGREYLIQKRANDKVQMLERRLAGMDEL